MKTAITIEEAEQAFEKAGIKPVRGVTYNPEDKCGCIWAGLYLAQRSKKQLFYGGAVFAFARTFYEDRFVSGVVRGWDHPYDNFGHIDTQYSKGYKLGITNGQMLGKHFFKENE